GRRDDLERWPNARVRWRGRDPGRYLRARLHRAAEGRSAIAIYPPAPIRARLLLLERDSRGKTGRIGEIRRFQLVDRLARPIHNELDNLIVGAIEPALKAGDKIVENRRVQPHHVAHKHSRLRIGLDRKRNIAGFYSPVESISAQPHYGI